MNIQESRSTGEHAHARCRGVERKTVLIVEDNELNMKLFHDLLAAHGYATIQTRNGLEALELARKHRPALILMDIQLPEVSGLEVTKWLKEDDELRAHSRRRRHRVRDEGRRGADPLGRLRGLHFEADLGEDFLETVHRFVGDPRAVTSVSCVE